jgi:hypothetical protein
MIRRATAQSRAGWASSEIRLCASRLAVPQPAFKFASWSNTSRLSSISPAEAFATTFSGDVDPVMATVKSSRHLVANVPGIISGLLMTDGLGRTLNVLVFDNEDAARAAVDPIRNAPRPGFLRFEDAALHKVLAHFKPSNRRVWDPFASVIRRRMRTHSTSVATAVTSDNPSR